MDEEEEKIETAARWIFRKEKFKSNKTEPPREYVYCEHEKHRKHCCYIHATTHLSFFYCAVDDRFMMAVFIDGYYFVSPLKSPNALVKASDLSEVAWSVLFKESYFCYVKDKFKRLQDKLKKKKIPAYEMLLKDAKESLSRDEVVRMNLKLQTMKNWCSFDIMKYIFENEDKCVISMANYIQSIPVHAAVQYNTHISDRTIQRI